MDPRWVQWLNHATQNESEANFGVIVKHPITHNLALIDGTVWRKTGSHGQNIYELSINDTQLYGTRQVNQEGQLIRDFGASENQTYYWPDVNQVVRDGDSSHKIAVTVLEALVTQGPMN